MTTSHAQVLRDRARQSLINELSKIGSCEKILIVEKSLISILDMSFRFSELENLLQISRIIEWSTSTCDQLNSASADCAYVFLVRSMSMETLPLITSVGHKPPPRSYLYFVPTVSIVGLDRIHAILNEGKKNLTHIGQMDNFDVSMIEKDLVSLQMKEIFPRCECENDPSSLSLIAKFLKRLECEFGVGVGHPEIGRKSRKFRKINAIGPNAKVVCDLFLKVGVDKSGEDQDGPVGYTNVDEGMAGISRVGGLKTIAGCLGNPKKQVITNGESDSGSSDSVSSPSECIDSVVLIDRRTDLLSLLCSQFTYEALIDEKFGIENCRVKVTSKGDPMTLTSSSDPLFAEIRDVSVAQIGQLLSQKANYISECYKEKDSLKSISEIKEFMDKFKVIQAEHASLSSHVSLATECSDWARSPDHTYMLKVEDQIMSMSKPVSKILWKMEKLIRRNIELNKVLRLLCLTSLVYGGKAMASGGVDKVLRSIVNRFGAHVIKTLVRLEQAGLLSYHNPGAASAGVVSEIMGGVGGFKSKWPKIREEFRLILEANNENIDPGNALAEAYSGYVPLSVRLVQLLNPSWKTCADKLALLRGPAIEIVQECPIATSGGTSSGSSIYVAVIFIGGVTYGEVAALRKLSQLEGGKRRFIVFTTEIVNYARLFDII